MYDWEGWPDFEHWVANVQISANAQRQRWPGESQADLAYRMSRNWLDGMINATRDASPRTETQLYGGWAADNKGCCSGSKLGIFDWRMLQEAKVFSNPSWYGGQKNLRLLAGLVRREKAALGPGAQMIPTLEPMGATAFTGGRLRSEEMFDVWMQCFANGATGVSLFLDPSVDDPGVYLATAEAIGIAAGLEDIIMNGTSSSSVVMTLHSHNAVASAIGIGNRYLVAISPDSINMRSGTDAPPVEDVDVTFDAGTGSAMVLTDLRDAKAAAIPCQAGRCRITFELCRTAVYLFAPKQSPIT